jgi:hypothetical protein
MPLAGALLLRPLADVTASLIGTYRRDRRAKIDGLHSNATSESIAVFSEESVPSVEPAQWIDQLHGTCAERNQMPSPLSASSESLESWVSTAQVHCKGPI